jgi:two-component system response regulator VicR
MKILVVDDDRDLIDLLNFTLRRAGFDVLPACEPPAALARLKDHPDLCVLDINLISGSGFDLLRDIRRTNQMPVIMLTARDSEDDKVACFELGADDYLTKPFSHKELVARIRAILRRHGLAWAPPTLPAETLSVGSLTLNIAEHSATKNGEPVALTVNEFRLLHFLMTNAGAAVPSRAILRHIWGYDDPNGTDVVRVAIHRLRRKIEDDPLHPVLLRTVPGLGFIVKADAAGRQN